jgi:hypothetical protein
VRIYDCESLGSTPSPGIEHDPARIDDEPDDRGRAWAEASEPDVLVARPGMTLDVGAH